MVVAQKVQHAVDRQKSHLALDAVAKVLGLLFGTFYRNHEVAEHVDIEAARDFRLFTFIECKRKDIGRTVNAAVFAVELVDVVIVRQRDADFAVIHAVKFPDFLRCRRHVLDVFCRHLEVFRIIADDDIHFARASRSFSFCSFSFFFFSSHAP